MFIVFFYYQQIPWKEISPFSKHSDFLNLSVALSLKLADGSYWEQMSLKPGHTCMVSFLKMSDWTVGHLVLWSKLLKQWVVHLLETIFSCRSTHLVSFSSSGNDSNTTVCVFMVMKVHISQCNSVTHCVWNIFGQRCSCMEQRHQLYEAVILVKCVLFLVFWNIALSFKGGMALVLQIHCLFDGHILIMQTYYFQ